jgi:uncharacterized protein (DUF927 family)
VLPHFSITPEGNEQIVYNGDAEVGRWATSGTAEEWRELVGRLCSGNSRLLFSVSCAFTGPLLTLCDGEPGGFHLYGGSTTGKTTALLVAGSALGGGGWHGFMHNWGATTAALEAIGSGHNDAMLPLDELSQVGARDIARAIYSFGNGASRSVAKSNGKLKRKVPLRVLTLSTGEITTSEHASTAGRALHRGADVRIVNLAAYAGCGLGVFERLHAFASSKPFSDELCKNARRYFGSPYIRFLRYVVPNQELLRPELLRYQAQFCADMAPNAPGTIARVAARFAMVAFAGRIATHIGLTGWEKGEAEAAAQRFFREWVAARDGENANHQIAIDRLRALLSDGAPRFSSVRRGAFEIDDRAGYIRIDKAGNRENLIFPEVFEGEICDGFSPQTIARELEGGGHLRLEEGRPTVKVRLPGHANPVRVYCVRESILRKADGPHLILAAN